MFNRLLFGAAMSIALAASPAFSQSQPGESTPTIPEDQIQPQTLATPLEFLSTAAAANEFVVRAGELALERAEMAEVRALAETMSADHTQAQQDLMAAGEADGVTMAEPSPDGEQIAMLGRLETVTGADFDPVYVETQIFAHQRAISIFAGYAQEPGSLGTHAAETLPTLEAHYEMIMELAEPLGVAETEQ